MYGSLKKFPRRANLATVGPALLFFNMKGCPYCRAAKPVMEQVASVLGSVVPVYVIDEDERGDLVDAMGVRGFPTIVYARGGGSVGQPFQGERTVDAITTYVCSNGLNHPYCTRFKR